MPLVLPLEQQILQALVPRMSGQGPDLGPAFDQQRQALLQQLGQSAQEAQRGLYEDFSNRGVGRSGAFGAAMGGINRNVASQGAGMTAQLGMQQQQQEQSAIETAIRNALLLEQQQSANYFGEQQLDLQRQQLAQQEPGIWELIGGGLGLAGSLFGAGGAFPMVGGNGGGAGGSNELMNLLRQLGLGNASRQMPVAGPLPALPGAR